MRSQSLVSIFYLYLCLVSICCLAGPTGRWGDQGDGTFRNPVIAADYSDPDPIRVGEDYYLVASTFESFPGVSILHSKDLVNWRTIGAALTDLAEISPAFTSEKMDRYNGGVYAPTISYHDGKFYIYVNLYTDGFYVATATDPAGPWESSFVKDKHGKPLRVTRWSDPCPFWDEDGKAYLVASHPGRQYWYSYMFQMSPDGKQLLDADSAHMDQKNFLYEYPNGGTVISPYHSSEGNRIFKRNGYYYLQHIEFTNQGQGEGTYVFRSSNLYGTHPNGTPGTPGNPGEYEKFCVEHVTSRDSLRVPGQGGYVDTPDGRWFWMGQFTKDYSCGRPPHLMPVTWINDWPVIGVDIDQEKMEGKTPWRMEKPVQGYPKTLPQGSDNFDSEELNPQWMWNHAPDRSRWSLAERPGYMRLYAGPTINKERFFKAANTLNQRYMRSDLTEATIAMDIDNMAEGQIAGLAHFNGGKTYAFIAVEKTQTGYNIITEENDSITEKVSFAEPDLPTTIYLRTVAVFEGEVRFFYSIDGEEYLPLGDTYTLTAGNFRGDMIGIFTYNNLSANGKEGYVDVDYFDYVLSDRPVILFIGDSITDGLWGNSGGGSKPSEQRTHWDQNHIYGHGYMNFCAAHYQSLYPEREMIFHNRGISGNTLANLEERWDKDAIALNPEVVSILIGTNDVDRYLKDPNPDKTFDVEQWGIRYQKLLDRVRQTNPDVKFVLCTPFVAYTGYLKKFNNFSERDSLVRQLANEIEQLAKDNDAILVPFGELFDDLLSKENNVRSTYWIWDGIHPTMAGHRRMADMWIECSSSVMEKEL